MKAALSRLVCRQSYFLVNCDSSASNGCALACKLKVRVRPAHKHRPRLRRSGNFQGYSRDI